MNATFTVGEIARRAAVTVRTLHYYEQIGLLVPSERTASGHRRYGARDIVRLRRIVTLGGLGVPLREIAPLLDGKPLDMLDVLRAQRGDAEGSRQWAVLIADVETALAEGVAPSSERAAALAVRWRELVRGYTGGNPEKLAEVKKFYADLPRGFPKPYSDDADRFIKEAFAAHDLPNSAE